MSKFHPNFLRFSIWAIIKLLGDGWNPTHKNADHLGMVKISARVYHPTWAGRLRSGQQGLNAWGFCWPLASRNGRYFYLMLRIWINVYNIYIYMKLHEYFQILTVFGYSLGWLSSCPMVMCHIVLLIYLVYLGSRVIPIMSNYETPPYGLLFYQGGHHLVDLCGFWQAKFRHPTWAPHSAFFP